MGVLGVVDVENWLEVEDVVMVVLDDNSLDVPMSRSALMRQFRCQFVGDELDELDVVDVVPGAHVEVEKFAIRLGERETKERCPTTVVEVEVVLICGMKSEVVLCVEAG